MEYKKNTLKSKINMHSCDTKYSCAQMFKKNKRQKETWIFVVTVIFLRYFTDLLCHKIYSWEINMKNMDCMEIAGS